MHIDVMQDHIDRGSRLSPSVCPIALAIESVEPEAKGNINVAPYSAFIGFLAFDLPHDAIRFIEQFDRLGGDHVKPFSFEMESR